MFKTWMRRRKTVDHNWEFVEMQILQSVADVNKVFLDVGMWMERSSVGARVMAEIARIFDEVSLLPPPLWEVLSSVSVPVWQTKGWALIWANTDAKCFIDQESKAGFWSEEKQERRRA